MALELLSEIQNKQEIASVFNSAAIISIKKGHHDDGLKLYDAALKALGSDEKVGSRLYYNRGIGFMHAKRMKEAHDSFKKAVEIDPDYEDAKYNLDIMEGKKKGKKPAAGAPAKAEESTKVAENPVSSDTLEPESIDEEISISGNDLDFSAEPDDDDDDEMIDT